MAKAPNKKDLAWPLFDAVVAQSPKRAVNPWNGDIYEPDYDTLARLLAVPLSLDAKTTSGVPALAMDVWVAYELRRAGLEEDWVWPRAEAPRIISRDILRFVQGLPKALRNQVFLRLRQGKTNGTTGASAKLLGKNYVKQVDVVVSAWETGPEVLISTKRMDSSFGNNASNRIEESYGDAKNLRLRYPQAACGFLFGLRSTAWDKKAKKGEASIADRLVDLLAKLGEEPDAYHATALVVPEYAGKAPDEDDTGTVEDDAAEDQGEDEDLPGVESEESVDVDLDVDAALATLPEVRLRQDLVPPGVDSARFFAVILDTVLRNTPVNYHRTARRLREGGPRQEP